MRPARAGSAWSVLATSAAFQSSLSVRRRTFIATPEGDGRLRAALISSNRFGWIIPRGLPLADESSRYGEHSLGIEGGREGGTRVVPRPGIDTPNQPRTIHVSSLTLLFASTPERKSCSRVQRTRHL